MFSLTKYLVMQIKFLLYSYLVELFSTAAYFTLDQKFLMTMCSSAQHLMI